jgi:hypothetical protein
LSIKPGRQYIISYLLFCQGQSAFLIQKEFHNHAAHQGCGSIFPSKSSERRHAVAVYIDWLAASHYHHRMREAIMRIRWILCLLLILGLGLGAAIYAQEPGTSDLLKISAEMTQTVVRLRGLDPKSPIKQGVKNKAEISQFLNERIQEEYGKKDLGNEGRMLKRLGLIPADIDYKEFALKLLNEQVGGFYDPIQKTFFIASWLPSADQKPVMIHELTHALQDQYFNVERIQKEDQAAQNEDRALAHEALLEGDATVVMLQYILDPMKRHFSEVPNLAFVMQTQQSKMQSQFPVFKDSPPYLQGLLLFSYGYGAAFLQYSWAHNPSWDVVNNIYSDLPASTEQIMHPEKYFANRDVPKPVDASKMAAMLGSNWTVAYKNVLGEFSMGLLLGLHFSEEKARRVASGWGGDQVLLLQNKEGKDAVLVSTAWDTAEDTEKFYAAMDEWFRQHYPNVQRLNETPTGFSVVQNGEISILRRDDTGVRFILGLPESDGPKLKEF